ncbi:hypothetical protein D8M04_03845 [Oceanobacillus piezotolerans]|uniref:Uncharacterized protein n=1 Tax=Oceanobacillus piezotolerans TaxID=2448030 RepID=A0A498DAN3_9BACI|nr:hypothetical protein D8M04_03845 [Oceanobacillus piezotolerans]
MTLEVERLFFWKTQRFVWNLMRVYPSAFFTIEKNYAENVIEKKGFQKKKGPEKVKFPVPYCKEELLECGSCRTIKH